jgi:hypothetical protein
MMGHDGRERDMWSGVVQWLGDLCWWTTMNDGERREAGGHGKAGARVSTMGQAGTGGAWAVRLFTCAGGCACARLGERAGGPTGAVAASVGRRGKRRGMRSSGGDSMVLTDVGTRRSPKKAWNGRTGMYRCAVGRYGRRARRDDCGERGSNGNEVTEGADGAHCRRGFNTIGEAH